jgi:flavin reductase (DIM6/NTAB) family NADH-FMN oxidoreductase RutF
LAAKRRWRRTLRRRRWQTGDTGCPRLEALASFDCRISQVVSVGTHDILFATLSAIVRHRRRKGWCGSTAATTR